MRRPVALLVAVALAAGCGMGSPNVAVPTDSPMALAPLSGTLALAEGTLERALKERGLGLTRPTTPFRPPENAALIDVPRAVFQAVLADDPTGGYLVVYELADPATAYDAATTQARWLASGPGAVQFVPGTTHTLVVTGNTLISMSVPPDAPDARIEDVVAVLRSLGKVVEVAAS